MRKIINKKYLFSYSLSIIALIIIYFWVDKSNLKLMLNVNTSYLFISLLFAIVIYMFSGIQYYYIRRQYGVSLKIIDVILIPIVGNLWSFIFPFQGNSIFITLFFKIKYNMKISESISISFYIYLITLSFSGLFTLLFSLYYNLIFSWLGLISVIFLLSPFYMFVLNRFFKTKRKYQFKYINKIRNTIASTITYTNSLLKNLRFTIIILILSIFRIILHIFWYYCISLFLELNISFLAVGLISIVSSIAIIIKVTPDNLGVSQIIAGGFMGALGFSPEQAILITLFASATTMLIIFTIGIFGNFYYFKNLNIFSAFKANQSSIN